MILVKFVFWSFCFFPETEAGPIWRSAFRSLWFRDVGSLRRKFGSVNPSSLRFDAMKNQLRVEG
jgi:hypothetical protein